MPATITQRWYNCAEGDAVPTPSSPVVSAAGVVPLAARPVSSSWSVAVAATVPITPVVLGVPAATVRQMR